MAESLNIWLTKFVGEVVNRSVERYPREHFTSLWYQSTSTEYEWRRQLLHLSKERQ
ncbi:Hypothetical predicted protein, partial [Paramuricea clavata]